MKNDSDSMVTRMDERLKSMQWVTNLALILIAVATIAIVVKIALG